MFSFWKGEGRVILVIAMNNLTSSSPFDVRVFFFFFFFFEYFLKSCWFS